jgi:hypothetical protein
MTPGCDQCPTGDALFTFRQSMSRVEMALAARGESLALHRDGRGAPRARRDDREYREYLREEQRSPRGCIARRMQPDFHHGLLDLDRRSWWHRDEAPRRHSVVRT